MKIKVVILILVSLVVGAAYLYGISDEHTQPVAQVESVVVATEKPSEFVLASGTLGAGKDVTTDEIEITVLPAKQQGDDMSEQTKNHYSNIIKSSPEAKQYLADAGLIPSDLNGEHYVEFDLDSLRALEEGNTFDMTIPQTAEEFSAEVTKVTVFPNGDKSVHALVVGGDGRFHNTVLTVGSDALYGQFTVPSGNYAFESKNQHGWIAAKRDLYKNHVEHMPNQGDSDDHVSSHNHDPISVVNNGK